MSTILLQKREHFDSHRCLNQLVWEPNGTQLEHIKGTVYVAMDVSSANFIETFSVYRRQLICNVENVHCKRDLEKCLRDYINCLLDVDIKLKLLFEIVQSKFSNLYFKSFFEAASGIRIIRIVDLFHALTWFIIRQQISLSALFSIKNRLCESLGKPVLVEENVFYMYPTVQELANVDIVALRGIGLSRHKNSYRQNTIELFSQSYHLFNILSNKSTQGIARFLVSLTWMVKLSSDYVLVRCFKRYKIYPPTNTALINSVKMLNNMNKKPIQDYVAKVFKSWGRYLCFLLWNWHSNLNVLARC